MKPFLNVRFLICFLIAWIITNGWSYLFVLFGGLFKIGWMTKVGISYLALLWLPGTPEKILTVAIALVLHKILFNKDEKSKMLLNNMKDQSKKDWQKIKNKFKKNKSSGGIGKIDE